MKTTTIRRRCALTLLFIFCLGEFVRIPLMAYPNVGGPGTPEAQSFTPADVTQLVNPFTGDFSYNIPLLDVGGYPINISYHSSVSPDQEASWVGLGWNLNVGTINRNVQGLPDDFMGDSITRVRHLEPSYTIGNTIIASGEVVGAEFLKGALAFSGSQSIGFEYGNYKGWDYTVGSSNGIKGNLSIGDNKLSGSLALSSGYSRSSGNYIRPSVGIDYKQKLGDQKAKLGVGLGLSATSREGLESLKFKVKYEHDWRVSTYSNGKDEGTVRRLEGGSLSFPLLKAKSAYTPSFGMPRLNVSATFGLKVGGEISFVTLAGETSGYISTEYLKESRLDRASFGYLYADKAEADESALMDVNREKDGPWMEKMPHLPVPTFTHDLYSVTGQGFQGQFRPFRSDIGMLSDPKVGNDGLGGTGGAEAAFGKLVKAGVDISVLYNQGESGRWKDENQAANHFQFKGADATDPLYEPVYFKQVGEMTTMNNPSVFNTLGGFNPFYVNLNGHIARNEIQVLGAPSTTSLSGTNLVRQNRESRLNVLTYLTAQEASQVGLNKVLHTTAGISLIDDIFNEYDVAKSFFSRDADFRKPHHISEMTLIRDNGMRYVYGLPAYNMTKKEVSFNASGLTPTDGQITYTPGEDNSAANQNGIDHSFAQTETPAYAYAHHLTAVLSPDYVDVNGNGPSPEDLGSYTRFHYYKPHDEFGWRMPFEQNQAKFSKNYESDTNDDLAHYVYGKKEVYYLNVVETKNFIAQFYTSARADGADVQDENGGAGLQNLHRLDSIKLFARADVVKNGPAQAEAIKKVVFEYDYSLCNGAPGSSSGKLTLKRIFFTYGRSNLNLFNDYEFTYGTNPNYAKLTTDRWGMYSTPGFFPEDEYPYATKVKTLADTEAKSWLLSQINTPERASISVEYEADDYAFVQDRLAQDMHTVAGFSETEANSMAEVTNELYTGDTPNRYLYFLLVEPANSDEDIRQYVLGLEELYFRARIQVQDSLGLYEDIKGFVPFDSGDSENYGLSTFSNNIGWIKLPAFDSDGKDLPTDTGVNHPFTKAAAQSLAKNVPKVAYGLTNTGPDDILQFLEAVAKNLGGFLANVLSFENFVNEFRGDNRGRIVADFPLIRLNNGKLTKLGGGARVKQILINDNWEGMSGTANNSFSYGQEYEYTRSAIIAGRELTFSSGVASYEPVIGNEENVLVEPARYHVDKKLASDVNDFSILPVNGDNYPSPAVGYSRVKVRNIKPTEVDRTATGHMIYEYYTAFDFPTKVQLTNLKQKITKPVPNPFLHRALTTTSQGYSIELNNMHGMAKSQLMFSETDSVSPISGTRFYYKTDPEDVRRLDNRVQTLDPETGMITEDLIGVEYEVVVDARQSEQTGTEGGAAVNVDVDLNGPIPLVSVSGYPQISRTEQRYRSIVTNKIIMRSGVLDRIESFDKGARVTTQNELYDGETGKVLISSMNNEFGGQTYQTSLPAYWMYEQMGLAYQNICLELEDQIITSGTLSIANADQYFQQGDEVALFQRGEVEEIEFPTPPPTPITRLAPAKRAWVLSVSSGSVQLIDEAGQAVNDTADVKIIRSGYDNLIHQMGGDIITRGNPIDDGTSATFDFNKVIDANAQLYDAHWQTYLGYHIENPSPTCFCAPATDVQNFPLSLSVRDFLANNILDGATPSGRLPIGGASVFLPPEFSSPSTGYYVENHGSLIEVIVTDTLTGNSCDITIETEDGSPVPEFAIANTAPEFLSFSGYGCDGTNEMRLLLVDNGQIPRNVYVRVKSNCINFLDCVESFEEFPEVTCGINVGSTINPFTTGIYGNWRPKAAYKFVTDRDNSLPNLKDRGFYEYFYPFFSGKVDEGPLPVNGVTLAPISTGSADGEWQQAVEREIIDPLGKELEHVNALGIPSASVFGYNFHMPIAVAQRAHHQDIAFDGFEDYDFINAESSAFDACDLPAHWRLPDGDAPVDPSANIARDEEVVHSGRYSLRVDGDASITRDITPKCDPTGRTVPSGNSYSVQDCDLIRNFSPTPGEYWISGWIREKTTTPVLDTLFERSSVVVKVVVGGSAISQTFKAAGPIVDGWQQFNGYFSVPDDPNLQEISVSLQGPSGDSWSSYFDDIRIQPFNAVMTTYVYDPINLRLITILDERNYGTFYEYDTAGNLARTEKETERGRLTVQEIRTQSAYTTK